MMGRLQEYLAPRLAHPEAVWVLDGSDFPKQGQEVGGGGPAVLWEIGQGGQLPGGGMFLAYVSPQSGPHDAVLRCVVQ